MRGEESVKVLMQCCGAVRRKQRERSEAHCSVIPKRGPSLEVAPVNRHDCLFKGGFEIVKSRTFLACPCCVAKTFGSSSFLQDGSAMV